MAFSDLRPSRRNFLGGIAAGSALFTTPGLFAEELTPKSGLVATPRLTEGPFYPDKMPLDTDNDLLIVNNSITPAVGEIAHVSGRVLSISGTPIRNAFVEIWQVDNNGIYLNSRDSNHGTRDANFQGYGRFLTDVNGQYYFRTIKPVPYPGRAPHIHVAISQNGRRIFTTQLLINGHPRNERDGVFREIRDPAARKAVLVDFKPIPDSRIGELAANFDVILGYTPADSHDEKIKGSIGPSEMKGRAFGRGPGGPGGPGRGPGGFGGPDREPGDRHPGGFGPPGDRQ
jgi:protocatechuate 3,4-dioxygenase beta subunit